MNRPTAPTHREIIVRYDKPYYWLKIIPSSHVLEKVFLVNNDTTLSVLLERIYQAFKADLPGNCTASQVTLKIERTNTMVSHMDYICDGYRYILTIR